MPKGRLSLVISLLLFPMYDVKYAVEKTRYNVTYIL